MLAMRVRSISKRISCLAIAVIAMWLGGAGCALCCGLKAYRGCCGPEPVASCHKINKTTRAEHSCCQQQSGDDRSTGSISQRAGFKGCSLLPNQATSLAIISRFDSAPAPSEAQPAPVEIIASRTAVLITHHISRHREPSYLRCCALLI
jgi:hypothetical protein